MFVIKRDGREEPVHFDKITARINKLAYGLNQEFCDPVRCSCRCSKSSGKLGVQPGAGRANEAVVGAVGIEATTRGGGHRARATMSSRLTPSSLSARRASRDPSSTRARGSAAFPRFVSKPRWKGCVPFLRSRPAPPAPTPPSAVPQVLVAQKVAAGVYKGVTTSELDELAAETAASMTSKHPDYAQVRRVARASNPRAPDYPARIVPFGVHLPDRREHAFFVPEKHFGHVSSYVWLLRSRPSLTPRRSTPVAPPAARRAYRRL